MRRTIVFTGGGTAGHVFPGLAVIDELKKSWDGDIVWIGSTRGMERKLVEDAGISYIGVPSGKLRRYFSLKNISDIIKVAAGIAKSRRVLKRLKPDALFSKGGFVSVPPVWAAGRMGIPVITHESDADPGLATRLNTRNASVVCVSFEDTVSHFSAGAHRKIVVTGNPVRRKILQGDPEEGRRFLQAPGGKKIITVIGGSQGARQINLLIREVISHLVPEFFVVHQMGKLDYQESELEMYRTYPFIGDELPHIFAASDLIISRAGANSLAEIGALGKPSILIPLGKGAGRGDQLLNAELYRKEGAAYVLAGDDATEENLLSLIRELFDNPEKLTAAAEAVHRITPLDAAAAIAGEIIAAADGQS